MRKFSFVVLLLFAGAAWAQSGDDPQLRRLEAALNAVRQEQQAVYQQFQMIHALTQQSQQQQYGPPTVQIEPGEFPNYDDMVRERQERQYRLEDYSNELQRLYERYRDLGERAAQLTDQIESLASSTGGRR